MEAGPTDFILANIDYLSLLSLIGSEKPWLFSTFGFNFSKSLVAGGLFYY